MIPELQQSIAVLDQFRRGAQGFNGAQHDEARQALSNVQAALVQLDTLKQQVVELTAKVATDAKPTP